MKTILRNQSVDSFRLLAALCVVILHVEFPNAPSDLAVGLRLMSRWAIPFFFIVSGYFLAMKYSQTGQLNILPNIYRLIWIFLLWVFIYIPFVVIEHDFTTLFKLVTAPAFIYFGNYNHLWFIPSLLFGYLFIAFCFRYNVKILLPVVSLVCLTMGLVSGAYDVFKTGFALDYDLARSWLSVPFLYIGFLFFQKGRPNWGASAALVIFGAVMQVVEAKFLYSGFQISAYNHQFLLGTIPFAIGMAGLALSDLKIFHHSLLSKWGNEYSLGIYLLHPAAAYVLTAWVGGFAFHKTAAWQILFPVLVVCVSLASLNLVHRYFPKGFNILFGTHLSRIN